MIARYGCLIAILMLVMGCQTESGQDDKHPPGVLTEKQMVKVLVDVHTAEGIIKEHTEEEKRQLRVREYYSKIMQIHDIDRSTFTQSYNYYIQHPKQLEEIYVKVLEKLSQQKAEVEE
jgi:hypothetical protein